MSGKLIYLNLAVVVVFMIGCSKQAIKQESVIDTPEYHYSQGVRLLDKEDLDGAEREFNRSKDLSPNFAPAFGGIALVYAEKSNMKQALKSIKKGLAIDSENPPCLIAKGRVILLKHLASGKKDDDWWENAIKPINRVLKDQPDHSEALFYLGEIYKFAYRFNDASIAFGKVVGIKDKWSAKANYEWEITQKIVRSMPGTKIGSKIALIEKIDRADLAVLFMEELKLIDVLNMKKSFTNKTSFHTPEKQNEASAVTGKDDPNDINSHWAKSWINQIVGLKVMEVHPDGGFYPDDIMTRGEFAMLIQNILIIITGDNSLATKYQGQETLYYDINSSHPYYSAVVLSVNRGIIKPHHDGSFGMMDHISGADALLIIREFQNSLRQEF